MGVAVMVGVSVAGGVGEILGVTVQPGGMVGRPGRMEQAVMAAASKSPRMRRGNFIPFLYRERQVSSTLGGTKQGDARRSNPLLIGDCFD